MKLGGDGVAYTVKDVSSLAGISVRTLHYYDTLGLVCPVRANISGYRLYGDADLEKLQQVLFFRELGFSLTDIKSIINQRDFNTKQALLAHKQQLQTRQKRLERLVQTIDHTIAAMERGAQMSKKEMFAGFDPSLYEKEAKQRWGHTQEWAQSQQRTSKYTKEDWQAIREQSTQIGQEIAALMSHPPADALVQSWIGKHHQLINERFYNCSISLYRCLGDMYVQDERFTAYYEKIKPGLALFMQAAIHVYCDQHAE